MTREQGFFCFLDCKMGHVTAHGWKSLKKAIQTVPGLDVVEERPNQDPCAPKRRLAGHNFRIANDN